jgi:glutamate transport system substrate-binding protein
VRSAGSAPCHNRAVRTGRLAGVLAGGLALALAGCLAEDDPNLLDVDATDFPVFSTMYRLADAGTVRVGIAGAELDAEGGPIGFEVALAEMIAGALGIPSQAVTWVQTEPTEHERLIEDGLVDLVLAGFPVEERSLQIVDFAGPYHVGDLRLLAGSGSQPSPPAPVCTTADLAPALRELGYVDVVGDRYHQCVEQLAAAQVEAVVAPDLLLAPYVGPRFELVGEPVAAATYGIGLAKGDDEFRAFLNDVLETVAADGRWAAAWEATARPVLGPAEPPPVDRY